MLPPLSGCCSLHRISSWPSWNVFEKHRSLLSHGESWKVTMHLSKSSLLLVSVPVEMCLRTLSLLNSQDGHPSMFRDMLLPIIYVCEYKGKEGILRGILCVGQGSPWHPPKHLLVLRFQLWSPALKGKTTINSWLRMAFASRMERSRAGLFPHLWSSKYPCKWPPF